MMNLIDKSDPQLEMLHANLTDRQERAANKAKEAGESAMRHGRKVEELSNPDYQTAYFKKEIEKFEKLQVNRNRDKDEYEEQAAGLTTSIQEVEAEIEKRKKEVA